jgi:GGDEF domain-containing protein
VRALVTEIELPEGKLSCSAGVAALRGTELEAAQILNAADAALYSAKRLGRDRVELAGVTT